MNLKEWMKNFLRGEQVSVDLLPQTPPDVETVEKLINRTISKTKKDERENSESVETADEDHGDPEISQTEKDRGSGDDEKRPGGCCSYRVKRNIVSSMREVRRFANEHGLTDPVVQALLRIIAEIALNALKGKVSAGALLMLLNAMNFDKAREQAFREGEHAGRNAKIEEEYFPTVDDGLPKFTGTVPKKPKDNDFFSIARNA